MVANKAGKAWSLFPEYKKALSFFEAVIRRSDQPEVRAQALAGGIYCHIGLNRNDEARRLAALARKELPRLEKADREMLQRMIDSTVIARD
jgi:hypothetical protein